MNSHSQSKRESATTPRPDDPNSLRSTSRPSELTGVQRDGDQNSGEIFIDDQSDRHAKGRSASNSPQPSHITLSSSSDDDDDDQNEEDSESESSSSVSIQSYASPSPSSSPPRPATISARPKPKSPSSRNLPLPPQLTESLLRNWILEPFHLITRFLDLLSSSTLSIMRLFETPRDPLDTYLRKNENWVKSTIEWNRRKRKRGERG